MTRKLFRRNFHLPGNTEYLCIHDNADVCVFFLLFFFLLRRLDKQTSLICNETCTSSSCYPLRSDQLIYFLLNTDWASHRFCFFFFLMHSSPLRPTLMDSQHHATLQVSQPNTHTHILKKQTNPIVYCQDAELFYYVLEQKCIFWGLQACHCGRSLSTSFFSVAAHRHSPCTLTLLL